MKKLLFFALALLGVCASCSKDDEPTPDNTLEKEAASIASNLIGSFATSWQSIGTTQHEEFVFTPYSSPQKHDITIPGEYVNIDKTVTIYGNCVQKSYYNDHMLETSTDYLYTVEVRYAGATPRLVLYSHGGDMIYGNYSEYDLRNVTSTSFEVFMEGEYRKFSKP